MQHLTEEVTRRLVSRLPETKAYYSLSDLHDFQIPSFMINRIELELRRNLADSIVPPATDWANMDSSNVKVSWENFLKAIHEQVRLPRSFANSVFEVCVADILELLSQPRKHMTEVIFGASKELKFEEIRQSANLITVYHYLPDALIKYMHRKQLPSITKERAQQILVLVDEKITSAYTPLNWAQLIDPFYVLLGEAIETELLRQFFADKGKDRWAEFFDKEHDDISRTRFIEVLSMPELDGIEAYVPEQRREYKSTKPFESPKKSDPSSFKIESTFKSNLSGKVDQKVESTFEVPPKPIEEPKTEVHEESVNPESIEQKEITSPEVIENTIEDTIPKVTTSEQVQEKSDQAMKAVTNYMFNDETMEFEKVIEYVPVDTEDEKTSKTPTESYKSVNTSPQKEEKPSFNMNESFKAPKESEEPVLKSYDPYADIINTGKANESDDAAQPKAKNFEDLDDDDVPIYKRLEADSGKNSKEKPLVEQIKKEEDVPFWKRFMPLDPPKEQVTTKETDPSELFDFLAENEDIYISDIFGDVQNNYVEAIQDLANYVYWEQASKYIKEEIFRVNRISPLDDAALDFISRLQEWFTNKQQG
jgi:hypothetical protein